MVTSILTAAAWRAKYWTEASYQRVISKQRTAVVVGATSGIGQACAHRLAEQGFLVIAVGRDNSDGTRGKQVVQALTEASNSSAKQLLKSLSASSPSPRHEFYPCNAFSLASIQSTANEIQKNHPKIDALIMTQGMATTQGFTPTIPEGNDEKLTLHYYSRMCMIQSLLPALLKDKKEETNNNRATTTTTTTSDATTTTKPMPAVVVSILSGGIHSPYKYYNSDPSLKQHYSMQNAANAAGYYNDLGLDQLALENNKNNIVFIHAAPGFVNTNWGKEFHPMLRGLVRFFQPLGKSASDCAEYLMGSTVLAVEAGDPLPDRPTKNKSKNSNADSDNNNDDVGVYIINQYGQTGPLTKKHTKEARESIWKHTQEVLAKATAAAAASTK